MERKLLGLGLQKAKKIGLEDVNVSALWGTTFHLKKLSRRTEVFLLNKPNITWGHRC